MAGPVTLKSQPQEARGREDGVQRNQQAHRHGNSAAPWPLGSLLFEAVKAEGPEWPLFWLLHKSHTHPGQETMPDGCSKGCVPPLLLGRGWEENSMASVPCDEASGVCVCVCGEGGVYPMCE